MAWRGVPACAFAVQSPAVTPAEGYGGKLIGTSSIHWAPGGLLAVCLKPFTLVHSLPSPILSYRTSYEVLAHKLSRWKLGQPVSLGLLKMFYSRNLTP